VTVQKTVNTKEWDDTYKALTEFKIGKFFKNNAIKVIRFHDIVNDRQARILDVGCGSGKFLISLLEKGFVNLFGIEPDVELTKEIPKEIKIVNCPAERILFEDNSFDVVFIYGVLHHLKGKEAWLESFKEINRVLKVKGYLFILEPCSKFIYKTLEFSSDVVGFAYKPLRLIGHTIKEEKKELYDFLSNYKIYEKFIYEKGYNVMVNRRTIFASPIVQWMLTAQKEE
jgi:ubiquinone/menaquinone biosynthesis C-methylase UbiE